jgi:hypothetical protein
MTLTVRTAGLLGVRAVLVAIPRPLIGITLLVYFGQSVMFVNLSNSVVNAMVSPFILVALTL